MKSQTPDLIEMLDAELSKKPSPPSAIADDLYCDALDAATEAQCSKMMRKVLKLDPGHTDALLYVLHGHKLPIEQEIEVLRKIILLEEKRLGKKAFKELAGAFWGFMETRPYMRARAQLAACLHYAGRIKEAIAEWEAMLKLNPNDNQGVRYDLLTCYLALNKLEGAKRLLKKYPESEFNTVFAWGSVLDCFLRGNLEKATTGMDMARKQNPYTEAFITGVRRSPKLLPNSYSPGTLSEAECFAEGLRLAWQKHPEAMRWLISQAFKEKPARKAQKGTKRSKKA